MKPHDTNQTTPNLLRAHFVSLPSASQKFSLIPVALAYLAGGWSFSLAALPGP